MIITHWFKITSVFPLYCFPCLHFTKLPFLLAPNPKVFQGPRGQYLLWTSHLTVLPGLFHNTDQAPTPGLVGSHGPYWPGLPWLSCLKCFLRKSSLFSFSYTASVFQSSMKTLLGIVPVRSVSHRQTRPPHPPLPPNPHFSLPNTSCFSVAIETRDKTLLFSMQELSSQSDGCFVCKYILFTPWNSFLPSAFKIKFTLEEKNHLCMQHLKVIYSRADLSNDKKLKIVVILLHCTSWVSTSFKAQSFSNFYCSFSYNQSMRRDALEFLGPA